MASGATEPDFLPELPPDTLHIIISRIQHPNNTYQTKISFSRKTRKYYAMGLLYEALVNISSLKAEILGSSFPTEDFSLPKRKPQQQTEPEQG